MRYRSVVSCYWCNLQIPISFQIIDPHDSGIAGSILQNLIPDERLWNHGTLLSSSDCLDKTQELTQAYFEYISGLKTKCAQVLRPGVDNRLLTNLVRNQGPLAPVKFVNTSMHGVSSPFVKKGMQVFGFPEQAVVEVAEQRDPDPEFPTVAFPNPEEKGLSIVPIPMQTDSRSICSRGTCELLLP